MKNPENVDVVLIMEEPYLTEAAKQSGSLDPRTSTDFQWGEEHLEFLRGLGSGFVNSFGRLICQYLQMGSGWSVEVTDFNEAVSIKMTYTNPTTCRSASIHALIIFRTKKGICRAYINGQRSRTCNSAQQAAAYIRGKASILPGQTSSMLS